MVSGKSHMTHSLDDDQGQGVYGTVIGRYMLHSRIAAGGMASVYLGSMMGAADFSRVVAIKRMHPQFSTDREFTERFRGEAWLSSRLAHPNIVQTLDVVEWGDELLLVMEYIHGITLRALCADAKAVGRAIPCDVSAGIMVQVLHGLHAAHTATDDDGRALGIVHRDFSPQNILIGRDGQAKVLDFGIARAKAHVPVTAVGQVAGKYGYLAPEQINGKEVDQRTDIFAAGIVLWEMLTGERLFRAPNLSEASVMSLVLTKTISAPSHFNSLVSDVVNDIVLRALNREPSERFPSARDMALALERAIPIASQSRISECLTDFSAERLSQLTRTLSRTRRSASLVHRDLATRSAAAISSTESDKTVISAPSHEPPKPPPQPSSMLNRRGLAVSIGLIVLVTAGLGLWAHSRTAPSAAAASTHTDHQPTAPQGSGSVFSALSASPPTEGSAKPSAAAASAELVAETPAASRAAASPPGRPTATRTAPSKSSNKPHLSVRTATDVAVKPNCDPPTYLDAQGIRHFKEGCL